MITKEELIPLANTLAQIGVSGQNAILMGECLTYLQNLLNKPDKAPTEDEEEGD